MKVLVTGGAGQIGSTVIDLLLERGDAVLAVDNFATGRRDNLRPHVNLILVEGSIADPALVDRLMAELRPDAVLHAAASYKDPDDWATDALVNTVGTAIVARACKAHRVARLVYLQTALCYGTRPLQQPIRLDHPLSPAGSSYAISKTAGEQYIELSGTDWVTFRLANVIGPRNVSGPLPIFYERLSRRARCFVTPARRDFCYAGDLAPILVRALAGEGSGTYHFSSGRDVAVRELHDAVVAALQLNDLPEPELRPLGPDEAPSILLDPTRLLAEFGDVAFTPLETVVRLSVERWSRDGVVGGFTHLREARVPVR